MEDIKCVFCGRDQQEVPLLELSYKNGKYWICSQHMPVLIHEPQKLEGMLPDADKLKGHDL